MDNIFCWTLVILVVMVSLASKVAAIQCYSCSTLIDGDTCGDKNVFSPSSKKVSQVANLPCKTCMKFKAVANGQEFVTRSCMPTAGMKDECVSHKQGGYSGDLCYCPGNLCNGGNNNNYSHTLLVSSLVLSAIVYVLWD